ncbi:macrolide transport system ATP-binding/permease protein [Faunimonas pinastri]|uniref:Pyoverdine export ATP-binding/permease protein PvdT n=1 Tax=Faunimonas pinastri TaxID=1855383 RepID=A0A1H9B0J5_9HYPH|nr:MacB family efflux pump subunit [Faunimonas pinastri]SEP82203.1 macrolide transport system ATP-binding/permease protein [Faunimonas pinastri]
MDAELAQPVIDLADIRKTYRNGELAVEVLHGIGLKIYPGEFVSIMGASGSGKSTLMNILGCLDRPTEGHYLFDGVDVSTLDDDSLAELRRRAFGFIFQSYNLIPTASAAENVEVPAIYAGMRAEERRERAEELLTSLRLEDRMDHRPNQLSGGQQQRVSIARALMNGGRVILADEPTGALDSQSGAEVMALLKRMSEAGHTVVVITHAREVAEQTHRQIEIRDGRIVADSGSTHEGRPVMAGPEVGAAGRGAPVADVAEAVKMALRALRANLFRTILTLLGIVIGVSSVVAMLAIGNGAKQSVVDRIGAMGSNLILVRPSRPNARGVDIATLVPEDAEAIDKLPNVASAVPELQGSVTLRYGNLDYTTTADGTLEGFPSARKWPVERGTFINADDGRNYTPVIVLGQTIVTTLFPDGTDPMGKYILVNKIPFQVVGVMSAKGATPFGQDQDDVVFLPLSTGSLRIFGKRYLRSITVEVNDVGQIDQTQDEIQTLLNERHHTDDVMIRNMSSLLETVSATQNTLTILLGSVAAISLLVGGIGVMNIMLVSVTERTREIGVRKATGARTRDILRQFITEALVVSAMGGAIGVLLGMGIAATLQRFGTAIQFSPGPILLAFGCAFATGLIFGYMPARKAARLDPAVALSAE